jgi:hypothetical protein
LPPPEQLSTDDALENVALIAMLPSLDKKFRVVAVIASVPGGFATVELIMYPPEVLPPEFVNAP